MRELRELRLKEFEVKLEMLAGDYFGEWGYDTKGSVPGDGLFVLGHFAGIVKGAPKTEKLMGKYDEAFGITAEMRGSDA